MRCCSKLRFYGEVFGVLVVVSVESGDFEDDHEAYGVSCAGMAVVFRTIVATVMIVVEEKITPRTSGQGG